VNVFASYIDDRGAGDYIGLAEDLGINLLYLQSLMEEPFAVSNPSACLLKRISLLLDVSVGYLLGESVDTDPIVTESLCNWRSWVDETTGLEASIANRVKGDWQDEYERTRKEVAVVSFRKPDKRVMEKIDWDKMYKAAVERRPNHVQQPGLF